MSSIAVPSEMVIETAADMHALGVELARIVGPGDLIVLSGTARRGQDYVDARAR